MSLIAKITGVLILLIGLLLILGGIAVMVSSLFSAEPAQISPLVSPMFLTGYVVFIGIAISAYGLVTCALGEGLILLAQVADNSHQTSLLLRGRTGQ